MNPRSRRLPKQPSWRGKEREPRPREPTAEGGREGEAGVGSAGFGLSVWMRSVPERDWTELNSSDWKINRGEVCSVD